MKKRALLVLSVTLFILNCSNSDDSSENQTNNNVCEDNFIANNLNAAFSASNGYDNIAEFGELETHEYDVQINNDGEICTIGYQNPSTYAGGYTIQVINNTNNSATDYSGTHTFSQASLEYQAITPVAVSSGDIITIKRIILPGFTEQNQTVGRVFRKSDFSSIGYPITQGIVVFQSSNVTNSSGTLNNFAQPYIAFGFKAD